MSTLGHIRFRQHFDTLGKPQIEYAREIPTTPATLNRWLNTDVKPSDAMKLRIQEITDGAVQASAWLVPAPRGEQTTKAVRA